MSAIPVVSRRLVSAGALAALLGWIPAAAAEAAVQTAASAIVGSVRDASGAALPGATVEVASPALIERTKVAVTSDDGRYRIVDLRPGDYTVTFTLGGFQTVRRERRAADDGGHHDRGCHAVGRRAG